MSSLSSAASALFAAVSQAAGGPITYTRPSTSTSVGPIQAGFGKSVMEVDDEARGRIQTETHDFLIQAADLGALYPPQEGDQITRTFNGVTSTYELMTPPYRLSDSTGIVVRVHSKQV